MMEQNHNEKPEVYALRKESGNWQISRRTFLKAAGIGAALMGSGLGGTRSPADAASGKGSLSDACKSAQAHRGNITNILITPDDKYMITSSEDWIDGYVYDVIKCWDLQVNYEMLGRLRKNGLISPESAFIGTIGGKTCLFDGHGSPVVYYELPFSSDSEKREIPIPETAKAGVQDAKGNFYFALNKAISVYNPDDGSEKNGYIYEFEKSHYYGSVCLIQEDTKLFIQFSDNSYGILDLTEQSLKMFSGTCTHYSICPGGDRALIYDDEKKTAALVDLNHETDIWSIDIEKRKDPSAYSISIVGTAMTKDGKTGFLFERQGNNTSALLMISMEDGSILDTLDLCRIDSGKAPLAVTADGKRIIAAVNTSLFVISLPDLGIIALPTDFWEFVAGREGRVVKMADPESGTVYTRLLGRNDEIPDGAVCICNTVTGTDEFCKCYGHSCSCDGHPHYWHPN